MPPLWRAGPLGSGGSGGRVTPEDVGSFLRVMSWNVNGLRAAARKGFKRWLNRSDAHLVKHTDSTDIPVCLNKNAKHHRTMRGLAG